MPYVVATIACWLVGVLLTGRAFAQPAGWAFLGLGHRPGLERVHRRVRRARADLADATCRRCPGRDAERHELRLVVRLPGARPSVHAAGPATGAAPAVAAALSPSLPESSTRSRPCCGRPRSTRRTTTSSAPGRSTHWRVPSAVAGRVAVDRVGLCLVASVVGAGAALAQDRGRGTPAAAVAGGRRRRRWPRAWSRRSRCPTRALRAGPAVSDGRRDRHARGRRRPLRAALPALRRRARGDRLGRLRDRVGSGHRHLRRRGRRHQPDARRSTPARSCRPSLATLAGAAVAARRTSGVGARSSGASTASGSTPSRRSGAVSPPGRLTWTALLAAALRRPAGAHPLPGPGRRLGHVGRAARSRRAGSSSTYDGTARVTAKIEFDPARSERELVEAVAAGGRGRDRQRRAARRAGPPGRADQRVEVAARHRAPRGAPADRARPPRRRAAAAARHRAPAPVGAGQRGDDRAARRGRPRHRRARPHRPGAARPGRRPAARRARRRRPARRGRRPGRPHPADRSASTSWTSGSPRASRARRGSSSRRRSPTRSSTPTSTTVSISRRGADGAALRVRRRRRGRRPRGPAAAAGCRGSPTASRPLGGCLRVAENLPHGTVVEAELPCGS